MLKQYWDSFIIALLTFEITWIVYLYYSKGQNAFLNSETYVVSAIGVVAAFIVTWIYGGIKSWMKS